MIQTNDNLTTKDSILFTDIDLLSMKGFTDVSVKELARTVGISESSIYNHFSSKKDILNSIFVF